MTAPVQPRTTAAFYIQSAISFAVSVAAMIVGIVYLPVNVWMRGFLTLGLLYAVTSTFTLAKCVRDHQEINSVAGRVDQARLDRILADHDPYHVPGA
jgi:hypothetical protein